MTSQSMQTALLFSGQGSQIVGMGIELASSCAPCRATFAEADRAAGYSLTRLMADGPEPELRRTAVAQPAVLTLAVAHARHLRSLGIKPTALVGHSLGQYSALVIAESLDFADAVRLVTMRGQLMQATVPEGEGAMVAVVGLDRAHVYDACAAAGVVGIVSVACHNAPGQTVISGTAAAVAAAATRCEDEGGGIVPLPVSVPFHCDLLAPMVPAFSMLLAATSVSMPILPVIDNVTAYPLPNTEAVRRSLVAQVTAPVLFEESLNRLIDSGTNHFIQCGPGTSLLGFVRRISRRIKLESFEEAAS